MSLQDITAKNLPVLELWNQVNGGTRQCVLSNAPLPNPVCTSYRTPEEARAWLDYQGISVAQWSRENHMHQSLVRAVLDGRKKCLRGMSHNIAVLLGMKDGVLTSRPARVAPTTEQATAEALQ